MVGRVVLTHEENCPDFINAVYVDGLRQRGQYVATQLPLPGTREDFWRMVWQCKAPVVVVLNDPDTQNNPVIRERQICALLAKWDTY